MPLHSLFTLVPVTFSEIVTEPLPVVIIGKSPSSVSNRTIKPPSVDEWLGSQAVTMVSAAGKKSA